MEAAFASLHASDRRTDGQPRNYSALKKNTEFKKFSENTFRLLENAYCVLRTDAMWRAAVYYYCIVTCMEPQVFFLLFGRRKMSRKCVRMWHCFVSVIYVLEPLQRIEEKGRKGLICLQD